MHYTTLHWSGRWLTLNDQKTQISAKKQITYPMSSSSRLLRLTPVVALALISTKICGNFSTMHTNRVLKLATCNKVSDCMLLDGNTTNVNFRLSNLWQFGRNYQQLRCCCCCGVTSVKLAEFRKRFRSTFSKYNKSKMYLRTCAQVCLCKPDENGKVNWTRTMNLLHE